jgi:hypothetical protein
MHGTQVVPKFCLDGGEEKGGFSRPHFEVGHPPTVMINS